LAPKRFKEIPPITNFVQQIPHRVVILINRMMDLDADTRIQTPGQVVSEIDNVIQAIRAGDAAIYDPALSQQHAEQYAKMMAAQDEGRNRAIMLVESNPKIQDAFREKLKEVGYRVLIMSNPLRAYERFAGLDPAETIPADAVIIGCSQLGMSGVEAFNSFATGQMTKNLPLILMLEAKQSKWEAMVDTGVPHRAVIYMPLKVKEIRDHLRQMLTNNQSTT
jgi:CheY-like chemotaxis protein